MTKRIVSGIFILTALGALGVILAGALTSGEQLIVRFLTAVIVAALGLYVISDLRLQADDDAAGLRSGAHPRLAGIDAPPNSTAAFMATVTGKGESPTAKTPAADEQDVLAEDEENEPHETGVGTTSSSTSEHESAVVEDAGSLDAPPVPSLLGPAPVTVRANDLPDLTGRKPATITDLFAKRSADEAVDRTWPSFGVGSTPPADDLGDTEQADGHADEDAAEDRQDDLVGAERGHDVPTDEDIETLIKAETEASDANEADLAETAPETSTDFAYSGDLEAPVFEWPAAPDANPEPAATAHTVDADDADDLDAEVLAAAAVTTTIAMGQTGPLPEPETTEDIGSEQIAAITTDPAGDTEVMASAVNGHGRDLPSPFTGANGSNAVEYADAPLAPIIDLRNVAGSGVSEIDEAIDAGEVEVVAALIEQGMLSTEGPISDRDVRTMVYVAFTSNELRKLLAAGGSPDGPNPGIDLGPVELFKDGMVQPPKTLYPGPPVEAEARSQLG